MKLKECLELGKCCGLKTLGECFENVRNHSPNLFKYECIGKELTELVEELAEYKFTPVDDIENVIDKLNLEWYYRDDEAKKLDCPNLREINQTKGYMKVIKENSRWRK